MLIEFSVGNYKSFKNKATFSMVAAKITARSQKIDEDNVFDADDELRLLTSAAIYGANASGKSNLMSAMRFVRRFVLDSSKDTQAEEPIGVEPFRLSSETAREPSVFETVFVVNGMRYRYGFKVNTERVVSEWLYHVPRRREARLFVRDEDSCNVSNEFREGRDIFEKTRRNALFLSVVAQFNGEIAQRILAWFRSLKIVSGLNDMALRMYTLGQIGADRYRRQILQLVKQLDIGIDDIEVEKTPVTSDALPPYLPDKLKDALLSLRNPEQVTIRTLHRKYDAEGVQESLEDFDIDEHESEGTKKLFALAGPLMDILENGRILVIDELDARFHPLMTREIVGLFNSQETNPHHAQLVFATHDTNLLSNKVFRRDQIWFTEKDGKGVTHLYSLAEYRGVRNDASFESDYIRGKYGAIPFIGDLKRLLGEPNE